MNSLKFTKYSSKIENYDKHKWAALNGLRHSIVRFAPALQLPLLSWQYTRYYIQDGMIGKTSSIDFWTKAQQPINLSPIFARHHISICFKPFHVNHQARCLESFKSSLYQSDDSSRIIQWSDGWVLFVMIVLFRYGLPFDCASLNCMPTPFASKILPVPSYWISWLVIGFTTSAPPEMVCVAVEQRF